MIKKKDAGWVVQNALGSRLSSLTFMADDQRWRAQDIDEGAESAASKHQGPGASLDARVHDRFSKAIRAQVERPLKEGEFLAVLEGQGFTPMGGLRLNHHESSQLVRGEVER